MNQGFGIERPAPHHDTPLRAAARYLVLIESAGCAVARLFSDKRLPLIEFDASTEETATMISGLVAQSGASGPEWDRALAGHDAAERAAAKVYELSV